MTSVAAYEERLVGRELLHRGPSWLKRLRKDGWQSFADQGFPTKRHEDWKYTSTKVLEATAWHQPTTKGPGVAITTLDGQGHTTLFGEAALPAHEDVLGSVASAEGAPFVALNAALFSGGASLQIPAETELSEPLRIEYRCGDESESREAHPRTVVVVGKGSTATLVETWKGSGGTPYFVNAVTEIILEEGARLSHVIVQEHDRRQGHHVQTIAVRCATGARYESWGAWLGGALCRVDINATLAGEGAMCRVDGSYVAGQGQHIDVHSLIDHAVAHGTSRQLYKGVLGDNGRGVFNGKVMVREDAQKTDAQQANHNLLLSMDAEIDTKPQLEIFADDVKCSHGTTVGQVDEEQLFYLRSRGIPAVEANRMITRAFLAEAFLEVPTDTVREAVLATVQADLDHLLAEAT